MEHELVTPGTLEPHATPRWPIPTLRARQLGSIGGRRAPPSPSFRLSPGPTSGMLGAIIGSGLMSPRSGHYAHSTSRPERADWQPLCAHLRLVADLARKRAKFGAAEWG